MNKLVLLFLSIFVAFQLNAAIKTSAGTGNWASITWSPAGVPAATDTVVISGTNNVTVAANATCGAISIASTATLTIGYGFTLTVSGGGTSPVTYGTFGGTGTLAGGITARVINVAGSWTFNGTSTQPITLNMNGTPNQTLSGKITTSATCNLTINKASGSVILGSAINVGGALTLTSGIITTTSTNLLTLGDAATVSGGSATSYINGPMAYNFTSTGAQTARFPIGKGGIYRPVTLTLNETSTTSTTYTAELINSTPVVNSIPGTLDGISAVRYYTISKSIGSAFTAGIVLLNYGADDGVSTAADARVAQGPAAGGGSWVNLAGTGSGAPTGTITSATAFTGTTAVLANTVFVLADRMGGANTLPVELSSFTSVVSGRQINLNWETKTEQNSSNFVIERTKSDGTVINLNWTPVQSVKANFSSNAPKHYSFTDKNVQSGKYQYRLKMIDNNGSFVYSKTVEAAITLPATFELSQNYPNPFNPTTRINYTLANDSRVTLEVFNLIGERVAQIVNDQQNAGFYSVNFGVSSNKNITSGIYVYKLTAVDNAGNNFSSVKKMMLLK